MSAKISLKRYIRYWHVVFWHTVTNIKNFLREIRDEGVKNIFILLLYLSASYAASKGLLSIESVNNLFSPFGALSELIFIFIFFVVFFLVSLLFYAPVQIYYEHKKNSEKGQWNDVRFGEILPEYRNLLGLAITVRNEKLTRIENLSMWLVDIYPTITAKNDNNRRFGYVNNYQTDKSPLFLDITLDPDKEATFILGNYNEKDMFLLSTYNFNSNGKVEKEIELQKNGGAKQGAFVLDIEFRADGFSPKLIRYTIIHNDDHLTFDKYGVKYKKFWE